MASVKKNIPHSLIPGEAVTLKPHAFSHVKIRTWEYKGMEGNKILLYHRAKSYTLEVNQDDIDWEEYERVKRTDKRHARRLSLRVPVRYYPGELKTGRAAFSLDVSEEGIGLDVGEKLEVGENLKLQLLAVNREPIEMTAQTIWIASPPKKGETYHSGMKIVKLSPENKKKLEKLLGGTA